MPPRENLRSLIDSWPYLREENPGAEKMTALRTEGHTTEHTLSLPPSKAARPQTLSLASEGAIERAARNLLHFRGEN